MAQKSQQVEIQPAKTKKRKGKNKSKIRKTDKAIRRRVAPVLGATGLRSGKETAITSSFYVGIRHMTIRFEAIETYFHLQVESHQNYKCS